MKPTFVLLAFLKLKILSLPPKPPLKTLPLSCPIHKPDQYILVVSRPLLTCDHLPNLLATLDMNSLTYSASESLSLCLIILRHSSDVYNELGRFHNGPWLRFGQDNPWLEVMDTGSLHPCNSQ